MKRLTNATKIRKDYMRGKSVHIDGVNDLMWSVLAYNSEIKLWLKIIFSERRLGLLPKAVGNRGAHHKTRRSH